VDVFERLPTPFGLERSGVAPDHQKIKTVTKTFERTASAGRFRFLGCVEACKHVSAAELAAHYDQVVWAVGSTGDRRLGIPGEELTDVHPATAFVGWYNAHPDFREFPFDLGVERAVVVGVGNVALDVARVLLRDRDELAKTDIAAHALAALRASRIKEVVLLARRGPGEVAFTPRELEDIAGLAGVRVDLDRAVVEAEAAHAGTLDAAGKRNLDVMLALARAEPRPASRTLRIELLSSPVEVLGREGQRVRGVRVERNELVRAGGSVKARGTGRFFEIEAGLVFRSIGYLGVALPGVPFDQQSGTIPNAEGRVLDQGAVLPGAYAVGWIRRGPFGVIGTNKADAQAVVERMIADVPGLVPASDDTRTRGAVDALLARRDVRVTTYADWSSLDAVELQLGGARGKVREKLATVEEMMNHLLRTKAPDAG
jgi:ferredoxin--NADP+ reductase